MKPRGRPPLDPATRSCHLHLRLSAPDYDATYAKARAERLTMAQWIRRTLRAAQAPKQPGEVS